MQHESLRAPSANLPSRLPRLPLLPPVVRELREFFEAVCSEKGLGCELELKNEAASVHSDAGITQVATWMAAAAVPAWVQGLVPPFPLAL